MAEATDNKDNRQDKKPKQQSNKTFMFIIAGLLVMALMTAATGYLVTHKQLKPAVDEDKQEELIKFELGPLFSLEPFIVNLIDYNGRRYLKTTIDLEMENEKMRKDLEQKTPFVRNVVINVLSSKTFKDISSVEGKDLLRQEIVFRINKSLSGGKVKNVYFREFVVQ